MNVAGLIGAAIAWVMMSLSVFFSLFTSASAVALAIAPNISEAIFLQVLSPCWALASTSISMQDRCSTMTDSSAKACIKALVFSGSFSSITVLCSVKCAEALRL